LPPAARNCNLEIAENEAAHSHWSG
jgi:hypothetical protein